MRIVSGFHRGRRINPPAKLPVRPTTDAAKETLFNILANRYAFEEISFLDLFAGTGNISYEVASRGCSDLIAVDSNYQCTGFIKSVGTELNLEGLKVERNDVYGYLKFVSRTFDIIFADPPYQNRDLHRIHELVFQRNILKQEGCLIVEHGDDQSFSELEHFSDHRTIGSVNFTIFNQTRDIGRA